MSHNRKSAKKIAIMICGVFAAILLMGSMCFPTARSNDYIPPETIEHSPPDEFPCQVVAVSPPLMRETLVYADNRKEEAAVAEEDLPAIPHTEEDVDLLARLLTAEMGMSWVDDEIQLYVGSVVLNRMKHDLYPDTLYDVIYDKGQYSPTWTGAINNTPDERTIANARLLLEEGSILPENVIFQANFPQGDGTYFEYYDEILGTTTYFCYLSN